MIAKIYTGFQKLMWLADPGRWLVRALNLSRRQPRRGGRGLVLIQIDGLSHSHFGKALAGGYLPFMRRLKESERYQAVHHYSGIPSCTPAIQAELFYGVRQYVPAFKFLDHESGRMFTFYDSNVASEIEARIGRPDEALLREGSSYSNIFRGGAGENAHFCVASIGWTAFFHALNPLALAALLLMNVSGFVRLCFYLVLEAAVSIHESLRGGLLGYGLWEELKFILSRIVVTVGLRELAVLGARMDMDRGLPVIHANLFGYDDQAHRRGPGSKFAYWSLPGIDSAVRRIWKASQNALAREYEVWIYSDHGQEEALPYPVENHVRIEKAVERLFHQRMPGESFELHETNFHHAGCRSGGRRAAGGGEEAAVPGAPADGLHVAAQGPLGFVYPHRELNGFEKLQLAADLVRTAHVPLVLTQYDGAVFAFTRGGKFRVPEETEKIFGPGHPYLGEIGRELESLCRHPDAGAFVLSGWRPGARSVSFPSEYGSHAGPGPEETDGFAFLPPEIRAAGAGRAYLRPSDLRSLARGFLRGEHRIFRDRDPLRPVKRVLRVMTYNVHGCVGIDGKLSPERIARVIARQDPDLIALQELDAGRRRSHGVHQARRIAEILDMQHHFHPVLTFEEEMYGNAILSRYPLELVRAAPLPRFRGHRYFEPRGALWAEVPFAGNRVQLINTHLSFWLHEQRRQADALCGAGWLDHKDCVRNTVLCGDFNALPGSFVCRAFGKTLKDVQLAASGHAPLRTWFGPFPLSRIDHIFVSPDIEVLGVEVPHSRLERMASDHLPLVAELRVA